MNSRFDHIDNMYNGNIDMTVKGFMERDYINQFLDGSESTGVVLQGMEFRPDKIAAYYYGDPSLFWVISVVNNFDKGIQDYYGGREFILPSLNRILTIV